MTSGLAPEALDQVARVLRHAMEGPGTDEEAINSAMAGRSQVQVDEIAAAYARLFDRDLRADLTDELTDSDLLKLGAFGAMSATTVTSGGVELSRRLARAIAEQLRQAMDRIGTDESAVVAALTGRTPAERTSIRNEYQRLTGNELLADLRSELGGSELLHVEMLLRQGYLEPEDELFLAISGAGTDESTIIRVLGSLAGDTAAIERLEQRYHDKYSEHSGDLMGALRSDLSTVEYEVALHILGPVLGDVAFEDCDTAAVRAEIRSFVPAARSKVERAIRVLEQGWSGMSASEQAVFNRFYDPTGSGEIDEQFVARVLDNFHMILQQFGHDLTVECEDSAGMCSGARLYYTYGSNVHVCPYFAIAPPSEATRKARDFVHELAHNAMQAFDRPYYSASAGAYEETVTPHGPWGTSIPVIGPLIRAIARSDTLFHPDAYSWFAWTV